MALTQAIKFQTAILASIAFSPYYQMTPRELASRVKSVIDVIPSIGDITIEFKDKKTLLKNFDGKFTLNAKELKKLNHLIQSRVQTKFKHESVSREQQDALCNILIPDDIPVSDLVITAKLLGRSFCEIKKASVNLRPQNMQFNQLYKLSPETSPERVRQIAISARKSLKKFLLNGCFWSQAPLQ